MKIKFGDLTLGDRQAAFVRDKDGDVISIGDANRNGGGCDHCEYFSSSEIVDVLAIVELSESGEVTTVPYAGKVYVERAKPTGIPDEDGFYGI